MSSNPLTPRGVIQPFNRTSAHSTTPNNKKAVLKDNWIFEDDDFDYDEFEISFEDLEEDTNLGNKEYSDINIFLREDLNLKTLDSKKWSVKQPSIDPHFARRVRISTYILSSFFPNFPSKKDRARISYF